TIGRDIENAGYNFPPIVELSSSALFLSLMGPPGTGNPNRLTPIIPGNDLNKVRTVNSTGKTVLNITDQITFFSVDQSFNNGLPLSGTVNESGEMYTSNGPVKDLKKDDLVILSGGSQFAIGMITKIEGQKIHFSGGDPYDIN